MTNSGARRVVTTDSARASGRWHHLARWRHWRAGPGPAAGGIFAAGQAGFITFFTITVPAVPTFAAPGGDPHPSDTPWWDAPHTGPAIWLLGPRRTPPLD